MKRNHLLKKIACIASLPTIAATTLATIAATPYQAANAFSTITPIQFTEAYDHNTTDLTAPEGPIELSNRYAVYSFDVINSQSKSIHYLYASPSNVPDWEDDILGSSIVVPNETIRVSIDDNRASCIYDFKAIFSDGSSTIQYDINVCSLARYTF